MNQLGVSVVLKIKQIQNLIPDIDKRRFWFEQRQRQLLDYEQRIVDGDVDVGDEDRHAIIEENRRQALEEEDWRGYQMPEDLGNSALFTRTQLLQLIHRKLELDEEIEELKKRQHEAELKAKEEKNNINQKKKMMEERKREYNERMLLRFGNIIPLETLEVSGPSQVVLDLQNKFQKMEQKCNRKKEEAEADLAAT